MWAFLSREMRRLMTVSNTYILTKPWNSPPSYSFSNLTSRNLRFQPFLSYAEVQGGGELCRYCVSFDQVEVGKGQHIMLEKLIAKPSVTGKIPSNSLMSIPGKNFTWRQPRENSILNE